MALIYPLAALVLVAILAWCINVYRPTAYKTTPDINIGVGDSNMKKVANLVLLLVVIGIFLWLINTYVPMAGSIKAILNIVVVVATCVLVLKVAGLWSEIVKMWNDLIGHRLSH